MSIALLLALAVPVAPAVTTGASTDADVATLDAIVVTGTLPGPALWRVEGDGHVLWVLGSVSAAPAKMEWEAGEVETRVAESAVLIAPARTEVTIGATDVLRMASLMRSARAAFRLPDGDKLEDVLPAPLYARWDTMRDRYAADEPGIDRSRPLFAAQSLWLSAIGAAGMTQSNVAWRRVRELAEAHDVPVVDPVVEFPLDMDRAKVRAGIEALRETPVDDQRCFTRTLDTLGADLERMAAGANAWAVGDLAALRELDLQALQPPCQPEYDAAMGFQDRPLETARSREAWLAAAESALRDHASAFAVLPMRELVATDGLLAQLAARGFEVIAPDERGFAAEAEADADAELLSPRG